jgi:hypothetical protein
LTIPVPRSAEHLGQRHDDEHDRPGRADPGQRGIAKRCHERKIDQQVERLKDHASCDRPGHFENNPGHRALRQVFHQGVRPFLRSAFLTGIGL